MNLYRVTCQGMTSRFASQPAYGVAYVVAENPDAAYRKLRAELDKRDLGFVRDRALDKVELIAEASETPDCGYSLYLL